MRNSILFSSLGIGPEVASNRLGLAPLNTGFIDSSGLPNESYLAFHQLYASADLGVTFVGGVAVSASAAASPASFVLDSREKASELQKTVSTIRRAGSVPILQLMHAGRQADHRSSGVALVAPSPIPCPVVEIVPHSLTISEIGHIIHDFVRAARFARATGIRVVELHAAHGYLIAEFLSPYSNKRSDCYGGSFAGRFKLLWELLDAIRRIPGLSVGVRISGDEFVEGGITASDLPSIVRALNEAGAAYVSVAAGVYSHEDRIMPDRSLGEAIYAELGSLAKAHSRVPVMLAGNVTTLRSAAALVEGNCADLVLIGRALLADPELIRKSLTPNPGSVTPCTMRRMCKYHSRGLPHISCPHNQMLWPLLRRTIRERRDTL